GVIGRWGVSCHRDLQLDDDLAEPISDQYRGHDHSDCMRPRRTARTRPQGSTCRTLPRVTIDEGSRPVSLVTEAVLDAPLDEVFGSRTSRPKIGDMQLSLHVLSLRLNQLIKDLRESILAIRRE